MQNSSYWNPWQLGNLTIKPWCLLINEGSASTPAAARKSIIMHLMHGVSPLPQSPKTSWRRLWGSWGRSLSARPARWATTSSSCSPPQASLTSPATKFQKSCSDQPGPRLPPQLESFVFLFFSRVSPWWETKQMWSIGISFAKTVARWHSKPVKDPMDKKVPALRALYARLKHPSDVKTFTFSFGTIVKG